MKKKDKNRASAARTVVGVQKLTSAVLGESGEETLPAHLHRREKQALHQDYLLSICVITHRHAEIC